MTTRKRDPKNPIYHDDDAARAHLESLLWPQGPVCPRCGVMEDRITKLQGKSTRPGVYKCKDCRKPFTVTVGTVMERSKVSLSQWVLAAHYMASSKKGMSALQLQRLMGCTYETAWFLFHRLREAAKEPTNPSPLGGAGKIVEVDETYIGGKEKNRHAKDRSQALHADRKQPVVALIERDGRARSFHIASVTANSMRRVLTANVSRKSTLMTDGSGVYHRVGKEFHDHGSTDHHAGEYVRDGGVHSNTAESYFAILKRGVYGTFHHVSEAHLPRYLAEFDFRYSNREALGIDDLMRAEELLRGAKGRRLTYRQPATA